MNIKKTRAQLVKLLGNFQGTGKKISQLIQELDEKEKELTQKKELTQIKELAQGLDQVLEKIRTLRKELALSRSDAVSGIVGTTRDIMELDSLDKRLLE